MIKTDLPLGGSGGGGAGTVTTTPAGGGTPGKIAKFVAPTSIGDSIITEAGATISIAGSLTLGSPLTFANIVPATAISVLVGRGSAAGAGSFQEITLGSGLTMTGTVLSSSAATAPGGADTQVQFNDAATFGGDAGLVYNKTTDTLTGVVFNLTQGTITSDLPQLSGTVTWNNAGIVGPAWKLNVTATSANANALLMDLQVGGASKFKIDRVGNITLAVAQLYLTGASSWSLDTSVFFGATTQAGSRMAASSGTGFVVMSTYSYGFSSTGAANGTIDLEVRREAANYHAWRNGTNAQRGAIFNTYTSSTNNEGATQDWQTTANLFRLYTFKGSGGGTARGMALGTDSVDRINISATGGVTFERTITAAGTTGAQTINKTAGTVNFAAGATTLVVTNSLVDTSSIVLCVIRTNDATATIKNVVPAGGSFTITLTAAATAETSVGFIVH